MRQGYGLVHGHGLEQGKGRIRGLGVVERWLSSAHEHESKDGDEERPQRGS